MFGELIEIFVNISNIVGVIVIMIAPFLVLKLMKKRFQFKNRVEILGIAIMGCLFINGAYAGWVIIQDDIVLVSYGYNLDAKTFEEKEANVKEEYREKCRDIYIKFSRSDTVFSAIACTIFYFPYVLISCYFILGRLIRNVESINPDTVKSD